MVKKQSSASKESKYDSFWYSDLKDIYPKSFPSLEERIVMDLDRRVLPQAVKPFERARYSRDEVISIFNRLYVYFLTLIR